jgi:hypothetical protein
MPAAAKKAAFAINALQKMSARASKGAKRPRQRKVKYEAAHPTLPLPLLPVLQSLRGMRASVQLCDGAVGPRFTRLSPAQESESEQLKTAVSFVISATEHLL